MKIGIHRIEDGTSVKTYDIEQISMAYLEGWPDVYPLELPLSEMLDVVSKLKPVAIDDEDAGLETLPVHIDLYLPKAVKDELLARDKEKQFLQPPLYLVDAIKAVAEEVARNHRPSDVFKVVISE